MTQIDCVDCLKTYRPSKYDDALRRVLMYGFIEELEDERSIKHILIEHLDDENWPRWLMNRIMFYREDTYFTEAFNFYYQYLEKRHRQTISASFLCIDCEKYYCTNCVSKHVGHFTLSKDDKYNIRKCGKVNEGILDTLRVEGIDRKVENVRREQTFLCDIVGVICKQDETHLLSFFRQLGYLPYEIGLRKLDLLHELNAFGIGDLRILHGEQKWLITDYNNKCFKIFNIDDNKMTRRIKLSSSPYGITEIPTTDPSQCLIAVSFPPEKQISIMNIHSTPAQVVSCINVQGGCYDLAYCNNKLITLYVDTFIRVIDMSGNVISDIHLDNISKFIKIKHFNHGCLSVHSESETIYVFHRREPSCVISLSLDGHVLNHVTFTGLLDLPECIGVDKEQSVYVMYHIFFSIYKLSVDLRRWQEVFVYDVGTIRCIQVARFYNDKFYLVSDEGYVYIIHHDSSREKIQQDHDDRIRTVQYARMPESTVAYTNVKYEKIKSSVLVDMCILNDIQMWLIVDYWNTGIKIFNVDNYNLTRFIKLSSMPNGIIDIPSTDPSLIAVSFPQRMEVDIMNIHITPAKVISSINTLGSCYEIAYCNNKLIARCWDYVVPDVRDAIHVMNISGQMIKVIYLNKLPGITQTRVNSCRMSVHSESETIFVCHRSDPSCVISLSLDGQVLHSVSFTDLEPMAIHVDKDQNVYVADNGLPIYKLSADLRFRERVIDKDVGNFHAIKAMRLYNDRFYLVSDEGYVYIIQHDTSHEHVQREDGLSTKKFTE